MDSSLTVLMKYSYQSSLYNTPPPITEMENFQLMEPLILCWLIFMLVGMTLCNIFKTCSQTKISQQ